MTTRRDLAGDPRFRAAIAAAAHHAVTSVTGDDGCGHCDLYSLAGTSLLRDLTGDNWQPQVGSFRFLADPAGNGWLEIDARDGGLERMEYHVWIGKPGKLLSRGALPGESPRYGIGALVDLATRHLRAMVEKMPRVRSARRVGDLLMLEMQEVADPIAWTRPEDPPDYLWMETVPADFRYEVDEAETRAYYERGMAPKPLWRRLALAARAHFHTNWKLERSE